VSLPRFAAIDIGTNTVLLLVAERGDNGVLRPIAERVDITRLGRGVDRTRTLSPDGLADTLTVLRAHASEARRLGATDVWAVATSAVRDASNGAELVRRAQTEAGLRVEVLTGDAEAGLSFRAAVHDFGEEPLVVLDIGGGSTEVIFGAGDRVHFRRSFDIGSVRFTERYLQHDPPTREERDAVNAAILPELSALPRPTAGSRAVGLAGTVTTLCAVARAIDSLDPARVQGATLTRAEVAATADRLYALPVEARRRLPGMLPKRADVICAGADILLGLLDRLGIAECAVSDRGLRWGLLLERGLAETADEDR
jgi:exopolyphosphatase / guanosine-5'-triphosphate,3'-diphosphate pyrophosphatase